jgi:hypothetical protein
MKTVVKKQIVVLQYSHAGTPCGFNSQVTDKEAEKFVALDQSSGGYPYPVELERAHDFKTVEEARNYTQPREPFLVREVTITYEY